MNLTRIFNHKIFNNTTTRAKVVIHLVTLLCLQNTNIIDIKLYLRIFLTEKSDFKFIQASVFYQNKPTILLPDIIFLKSIYHFDIERNDRIRQ